MKNQFLLFFVFISFTLFSNAQEQIVLQVDFYGLKRNKESFLKSLLLVKAQTALDSTLIETDINRLKRLPSIAHAYYKVELISKKNYKVTYGVEENFTLIPFANVFSSSNDDLAFRLGLQEFNAFGKNVTLGGFYQYDIFNSFGLLVRAPNLFSSKLGLAVNYNDFITREPAFFDAGTVDYRYRNKGIEILGLYEFNARHKAEFGVSFFTEYYDYLEGFLNDDVPESLSTNKKLLKLLYNYENITYYYQYLDGFKSALNLQYVNSTDASLPDFLIGFNDFLYYKRVGKLGNWTNRVRLGLASNTSSPFAPFTVDNNLNIRGVGNTIDRGTAAIVINTEYRHSIIDKKWFVLQGNVFVDGGTWRNPGGDFNDFVDENNIRIYPGAGVRFIHKKIFNAVFRIDYGYGITKNGTKGLVFGIGQYF
ncbi:outer membrane protein assembly factor [Cellulophaga baltica]|uniref:outer membrane protein assembly factor n=1 Tax=Cellulophaga TaxID=104264 RepID=UPI001C0734F9|nr:MULTISPECIES: outer membrane protein assembly factor [Cellulophaga]MBU2995484.1 outer membrane protein assembly factor [Cellulophaga baltica]MDO6766878.1 outer membrane protein assembly factor [Cellulophaga sp. 1_MG-2023]